MALQLAKATPLLKPVVSLAGWTFVMEIWLYATRIPALSKYGVRTDSEHIVRDYNAKVPASIRQIADNYNHLHEQPTVFYAIALGLAIAGDDHPYTQLAAWSYVGLRIAHSLYQSLVNNGFTRFKFFITSSIVLAGMTSRLAQLVFN